MNDAHNIEYIKLTNLYKYKTYNNKQMSFLSSHLETV